MLQLFHLDEVVVPGGVRNQRTVRRVEVKARKAHLMQMHTMECGVAVADADHRLLLVADAVVVFKLKAISIS